MFDREYSDECRPSTGDVQDVLRYLQKQLQHSGDPRDCFVNLARALEETFDVSKGLLVLREQSRARFHAVATVSNGRIRRNLSLLLPLSNTLFSAVIAQGQIYTENFTALYDGSLIERQLLIGDDTRSFVLRPLKQDGEVVGLVGFSSSRDDAFVLFEEGLFDPVFDLLAAAAVSHDATTNN